MTTRQFLIKQIAYTIKRNYPDGFHGTNREWSRAINEILNAFIADKKEQVYIDTLDEGHKYQYFWRATRKEYLRIS